MGKTAAVTLAWLYRGASDAEGDAASCDLEFAHAGIDLCHEARPMKLNSFEAIARVLNQASVRYLVVGGLAVNAHGYLRFTKDVDLVVQLIPDNVTRALDALATLGYRPLAPVTANQFSDRATRGLDSRQGHAGTATVEQ